MILSLASPERRLRQVMGITVQVNPRTTALSGSSTVRLKCGLMSGWQPSITVRRYALKALVVSLSRMRKSTRMNRLAIRLSHSLIQG